MAQVYRPRGGRPYRSSVVASWALIAGGLVLGLPAVAPAQVTFTSSASVSHQLQGYVRESGFPDSVYNEVGFLSTNNPVAEPVQLSKTIGGTLGSGGASATLSTRATALGSAGLVRATLDGSTSAFWTQNQTSIAALHPSNVTVRWTDAYVLMGNPADPQPGRTLVVQAFLNLTGFMQHTLVDPALEFGNFPASSFVRMTLNLAGSDQFGRSLIAGGELAVDQSATRPGIMDTIRILPPAVVPVQIQAIEGQVSSMTFEMRIGANVASATGSQYFGADSTSTTFDADFGHTLTWGGISSVTDLATGQPVAGWSITSASGVDYAQAVPEPDPAAALLPLVLAIALVARRGDRTNRAPYAWQHSSRIARRNTARACSSRFSGRPMSVDRSSVQ